jgi:hypothetical protein
MLNVFQFMLLSVCRPRNLVASSYTDDSFLYHIFRLICVLLLISSLKTFMQFQKLWMSGCELMHFHFAIHKQDNFTYSSFHCTHPRQMFILLQVGFCLIDVPFYGGFIIPLHMKLDNGKIRKYTYDWKNFQIDRSMYVNSVEPCPVMRRWMTKGTLEVHLIWRSLHCEWHACHFLIVWPLPCMLPSCCL